MESLMGVCSFSGTALFNCHAVLRKKVGLCTFYSWENEAVSDEACA